MKVLSVLATSLAVLGLVSFEVAAQTKTKLVLGTEGAYKPWGYMEDGGKLVGFEIDMVNELCKRMSVECEIVPNDFAGLVPALTAGKFDAIFAGMNSTEKRREAISFSRPYALDPTSFGLPKGNDLNKMPEAGKPVNLADEAEWGKVLEAMKPALKGKVIGVQGSTTLSQFLEENLADTVTVREYSTTQQHDLDLAAGRIDGILALGVSLRTAWETPELAAKYETSGPKLFGRVLGDGISVGVRKEDVELKSKFDDAIGSMLADGSLQKLSMQWFNADMTPQQ